MPLLGENDVLFIQIVEKRGAAAARRLTSSTLRKDEKKKGNAGWLGSADQAASWQLRN